MSAISTIYKIVFVEDNPADVFLLREALNNRGIRYELTVYDNGETARLAFSGPLAERPHLVLLDLNLPCVDGRQLLANLRVNPDYAGVPIAILSSSPSSADRTDTTALGAAGVIVKPVDLEEFLDTVGADVAALLNRRFNPVSTAAG